jgi:hypothetical protein
LSFLALPLSHIATHAWLTSTIRQAIISNLLEPGRDYLQVNSQGRVKFRIVAPEAKSVGVTFQDSTEFVKGEVGAWIGYTRPLDEGCTT